MTEPTLGETILARMRELLPGQDPLSGCRMVISPATRDAWADKNRGAPGRPGELAAHIWGIPIYLDQAMGPGEWRVIDKDGREVYRGGGGHERDQQLRKLAYRMWAADPLNRGSERVFARDLLDIIGDPPPRWCGCGTTIFPMRDLPVVCACGKTHPPQERP